MSEPTDDVRAKLDSVGYMQIGEDWPILVKRVVDTLQPRTVLDVGCGPCRSVGYFKQFGVPRVTGIDGSIDLLKNPQVQAHRDDFILVNLEQSPCVLGTKYDLVWSYEVAEHIGNVDNYMITMTENAGDYVVMTAAPPSQGGTHHVNCQPREYWIAKFAERGFEYVQELVDEFKEGGWAQTGYMEISGMVFRRIQPLETRMQENRTGPKQYPDIRIGAHYCCFNDKRATYEALKAFRTHYPAAPVRLLSDGGADFSLIAKKFDCTYSYKAEQSGNGVSTAFASKVQMLLWLNRLKETCTLFSGVDWIVLLEDDVRTQDKISRMPPAPMAGPCTMKFNHKVVRYIRKKYPEMYVEGYSGCGGTIIHRETFLKCMDNLFDYEEAKKLDPRLGEHSDAILTFLFLHNGFENKPWADHSERSRNVGLPDAAFDHQFKEFYGKRWDDSYLETGVPLPPERKRGGPLRFHLLGLAHLPTRWEYVSCAYTWKILRLARMLKMRGHEVVFYGNEKSEVECDEFVPVGFEKTRIATYGDYDWKTHTNFKYDSNDAAHQEFNRNAIRAVKSRAEPKDFLLCTMGWHHKAIADASGLMAIESGIGYEGIFAKYKIFESYAWMHFLYGKRNINDGQNYDCVIPNYYDSANFPLTQGAADPRYLLHISRLIPRKGLKTSIEVAKACGVKLVVAGQGDITPYLDAASGEVEHVGVVSGEEKTRLFQGATAVIMPTTYIGPFEGVVSEAQLYGVPVLTTDWGAFAETVEHGKTGFRCRTLREFVQGYQKIVAGDLQNTYIRDRAVSKWDLEPVSRMYEDYFYSLLDLYDAGWYTLGG